MFCLGIASTCSARYAVLRCRHLRTRPREVGLQSFHNEVRPDCFDNTNYNFMFRLMPYYFGAGCCFVTGAPCMLSHSAHCRVFARSAFMGDTVLWAWHSTLLQCQSGSQSGIGSVAAPLE